MLYALFGLSLIGGFCSGLLGVGGAVILIPLLLTVPKLLGVGELTMHSVAGLSMLQVLAASIVGWLSHRKSGYAHILSILSIGIPMGIFSYIGAKEVSKLLSEQMMSLIFGCLVVIAFILLLKKTKNEGDDNIEFDFKVLPSVISGSCVGFVAGIIGAGGGFILIPVMIKLLKVPIRVTVGSSLGIVFIGALMGSIGKIMAGQVEWAYLLPVIAGAIPASFLGAYVSKRISATSIRKLLLSLVLIILVKTWYGIIIAHFATQN